MRTLYRALWIVGLVVGLLGLVLIVVMNWQIDRDIDGWKERAQVSSEPNDMLAYMTSVRQGMERWGMTSGYAALIFPTPYNDMSLIYRAVGQHIDQARILVGMDRSSPEYQTGLDNLRGSIRELNLHSHYFWGVHQGLFLWIVQVLAWSAVALFGWKDLSDF